MTIMALGLCGCGESTTNGDVDVQLNDVETYSNDSVDDVAINDVNINLQEWNEDEIYVDLLVNITNKFDFDCSTIGLEIKILDEQNNILEKTNATLNNIASGESGNATVTLDKYDNFKKMKTIEIYDYGAWKKGDKEVVEGTFSKKQVFDISNISVKESE